MLDSEYHLDLNSFRLSKLKGILEAIQLLPSQRLLQEQLDERFAVLEQHGIENLAQLQSELKTKAKLASFANATGLPIDYLTILRREVNSYQPKPINLRDFPGVNPDTIQKLEGAGIKNTKQLFPHVLTSDMRASFVERLQIDADEVLELTRLTDVARTKWVGPKFARLLVKSDYDTVEKIANADYEELYQALVQVNEEKGIYKGGFGLDDMRQWVNFAVQDVPRVIQY